MSDGQTLIVSTYTFPQPFPSARSLTAIDLQTNRALWQIAVALYAPLYFVHDFAEPVESLPDHSVRPLLVYWTTGEQRVGDLPTDRVDLAKWVLPDQHVLVQSRQLEDVLAIFLAQPNRTSRLMGLNSVGLPIWQRKLSILHSEQQGEVPSAATVHMADRMAVLTQASQVEIIDLRTGETTQVVTPESLGLVSRTRPLERSLEASSPPVRTSAAEPTVPPIFSEKNAVPWLVVILLLGYLVVRRVALRPGNDSLKRDERSAVST